MVWYKSQPAFIGATLALILLVGFLSLIPLSQYCKPDRPEHPAIATENRSDHESVGSDESPFVQVVKAIYEKIGGPQEADKGGKKKESWWHSFWCEMKVTDFFLAAFTLWLVVIGTWQGIQLKRTVDSSEDANSPYVFPHLTNIYVLPNGSERPSFSIALLNYGKTPAVMKEAKFELHVLNKMDGYAAFTEDAQTLSGLQVIGAEGESHQTWPYTFYRTLTPAETALVKKKISNPPFLRFYVTGKIVYDDFFGFTHTVGCCFKLFNDGSYLVKDYPGFAYVRKNRSNKAPQQEGEDEV